MELHRHQDQLGSQLIHWSGGYGTDLVCAVAGGRVLIMYQGFDSSAIPKHLEACD